MKRNPNCRACGLWKSSVNVCIWGDGPKDADVFIIGEAPGEYESRTGLPFQGRSGRLLRDTLEDAGLNSTYITNLVKCRPPENRAPTKEEIAACRPYLDAEMAEVKSKAIVTLGSHASKAVLKVAKITEQHGRISTDADPITMPCYHPAFVLRDPSRQPSFEAAIKSLASTLAGERRRSSVDWSVVTYENWDEFIRQFQAAEQLSFDIETTGLFPYRGDQKIHCIGFGLPDHAWVLPLEIEGSPLNDRHKARRVIQLLVELSHGKKICAHNGKFDNSWLMLYYGVEFYLTFDTMLAHHSLDENSAHGLKELVRLLLNEPEYDLGKGDKRGQGDPQKLYKYCAHDVAYTLRLASLFEARLRREARTRRLFYELVMPAARAFRKIDDTGHFIRTELKAKTRAELAQKLEDAEAELNSMIKAPINWNSPAQVGQVLFKELKLPITILTDGGAPSSSEAALIDLADKHPIAPKIIEYRGYKKTITTYLDGLDEFMVGSQLFLSTKLHGTVTGRYSSRLHSIPRDTTIRSLFSAPPGWTFVQGDFSQAEVRIVATMSGDPELQRCFLNNIDVHWRTLMNSLRLSAGGVYLERAKDVASKLEKRKIRSTSEAIDVLERWGHEATIAVDKSWKEARKRAKGIVFGFIYGMGAESFVEYAWTTYGIRITLAESERERDAFFSLYDRLLDWHEEQRSLAKENGFVMNLAGRRRRLPGVYSSEKFIRNEAQRQAINAPVQGYIGDHKAMAVVALHETFDRRTLKITGEHHDAILMWVRDGAWEEIKPEVTRLMMRPPQIDRWRVPLTVPLVVDFTLGPWGS